MISIKGEKFLKIAWVIFFSGFFLGYTLRFLDVARSLAFGFEPIYPIHRETMYSMKALGYSVELEFLDVLRANIVPAVTTIGGGALLGIPSATLLFVIGIVSGASFAEIVEFTPLLMNIKVAICLAIFMGAMVFSASVGFQIGEKIYNSIRRKEIKVERELYDHFLIASVLVILGIIIQYLLLVRA